MKRLICMIAMLLIALPGHAETKTDKIAKLMEAQGALQMWQEQLDRGQAQTEKYAKQMIDQVMSQIQPNEVVKQQMIATYNKFISQIKNPWTAKDIVDVWSKFYGANVSEKELDQLIAFYTSDIGKKDVAASRKALADCTLYFQQARQPIVEKALKEYTEDLRKIVSDATRTQKE